MDEPVTRVNVYKRQNGAGAYYRSEFSIPQTLTADPDVLRRMRLFIQHALVRHYMVPELSVVDTGASWDYAVQAPERDQVHAVVDAAHRSLDLAVEITDVVDE